MDCHTAEEMVGRYISHSLSVKELEMFIQHIRDCPECYEELESQFIVHKAVEQLQDENETDMDFRRLLEKDLKGARRYIRIGKLKKLLVAIGSALVILAALAVIWWLR